MLAEESVMSNLKNELLKGLLLSPVRWHGELLFRTRDSFIPPWRIIHDGSTRVSRLKGRSRCI